MSAPRVRVPLRARAFIERQPVARLATADEQARPHVIPICFVFDGRRFYTPLDRKPKRVPVHALRRVQNLRTNPHVAVLFDRYTDDWSALGFVLVRGRARLLGHGNDYRNALKLLTQKYPQYRAMRLQSLGWPVIAIEPLTVTRWGRL